MSILSMLYHHYLKLIYLCLFVISFIFSCFIGCKREGTYPDYSSPVYTWNTFTTALIKKDYEIAWSCFSDTMKINLSFEEFKKTVNEKTKEEFLAKYNFEIKDEKIDENKAILYTTSKEEDLKEINFIFVNEKWLINEE